MKVLNISSGDLIGSRFNGFDMIPFLAELDIESSLMVFWGHESTSSHVKDLSVKWASKERLRIASNIYGFSRLFGFETLDYPWTKDLFQAEEYTQADVVHLQIVQNATLDLKSIERIMFEKPTVWTWHDPWPVTGHCVHPMTCNRWQQGCGRCPDLERPFKVGRDRTSQNRIAKNRLIGNKFKLHLSTDWFKEFLEDSGSSFPEANVFPFGIDTNFFQPRNKSESRARLGIPLNDFVVGVRSTSEPYKGLDAITDTIESRNWVDTTFLTVQNRDLSLLAGNGAKFRELGWIGHDDLVDFYNSIDVFLMPSSYETFGFMCVESMSCGKPVIVSSATPMSSHINRDEAGISLESIDVDSIVSALDLLREYPEYRQALGDRGRELVLEKFKIEKYLANLAVLYSDAIKEFSIG